MKNKVITILLSAFFAGILLNVAAQEDATTILKKMDQTVFSAKDKTIKIKMVMFNGKTGKKKTKEAILLQKGAGKKIFKYTGPKSDSGITMLTLTDANYIYLPMFKKPKKITNLAESNTFNKSDFSLKDTPSGTYSDNFTGKLIGINDTAYVVDLFPKEAGYPYSHITVYINKTHYFPTVFEYYDQKNQLVKRADYHYKKISGLWVADISSMKDLKKNKSTTIYMSDIRVNTGLNDDLFTPEKFTEAVPKG